MVLALLLLGVSDPRDRQRRKLGQGEEHHDEMTCLQVRHCSFIVHLAVFILVLILLILITVQFVSEKGKFDKTPAVSSFPADMSLLASTLGSPFILVLFLAAAAR